MVFTRTVKADHSTPGFRWKPTRRGGIKGHLTSPWPLRIKTRFYVGMGLGFWLALLTVGPYPAEFVTTMLATYGIVLIWPCWPLGTSIRMSPEHLQIGGKRYVLSEVSQFSLVTYKKAKRYQDREQITFSYGRKDITLRPIIKADEALLIAKFLNWARSGLLERGSLASDHHAEEREADRAAAF